MQPEITLKALPLMLWLGGVYYLLPALVLACIVFLIPALRRNRIARAFGFFFVFIAAICPISGAVTFFQFGAMLASDSLDLRQRTHHLKTPETLAGILFPAGSTITLQQGHPDFIESRTLSQPTAIYGYPLIGDFTMEAPNEDHIGKQLSGTLAQPTLIQGLPCAAAPINTNQSFTNCTLAQPFTFHGFSLAPGKTIQTRLQPNGDILLDGATLAVPTLIYDILYPAGTDINLDGRSAAAIAHQPFPDASTLFIGLHTKARITLGNADLQGPLTLHYYGHNIDIENACPERNGQTVPDTDPTCGFGLLAGTRFTAATYDQNNHIWTDLR